MNKIKHLFFDLDNTILDFSYASHIAFQELLTHFGHADFDSYKIYGVGNLAAWRDFEQGKISALELRAKRFNVFLEKMGWEGEGLEWNKIYMEAVVSNNKFVDGAHDVVENLARRYKLHIVTNGLREAQRPRITLAGLDPLFSSITVSDEIGAAKPQHDFFETAMNSAGITDKSEVLMIGDGYGSDILGGYNYGLKTCWFNHDKIAVDSKIHDFEIHHISELQGLLI